MEARSLLRDEVFSTIVEEIRNSAGEVFFNPNADAAALADAHAKVRAVQTFLDALQVRINAEMIEDKKKGLHRASDRQTGRSGGKPADAD